MITAYPGVKPVHLDDEFYNDIISFLRSFNLGWYFVVVRITFVGLLSFIFTVVKKLAWFESLLSTEISELWCVSIRK